MFSLVKKLFNYRFAFVFIFIALAVKVYQKEVLELFENAVGRYVEKSGESIPVKFNSDDLTLLTAEQLAQYNGENGAPIYLALLGVIFDVSRGLKHYGPGCSYNFFAGRDASVSFVSGEFEKYDPETADDVLSLKPSDLLELAKWQQFYEKEYLLRGKLIGRFYDQVGQPTIYHHKYLALLEQAQLEKAQDDEWHNKYPGCNIEWNESKGTRVWCTPTSGDGKPRDWSGYPRKLYNRNNKNFHCACVPEASLSDPNFKQYENCPTDSLECFYRV